MSPLVYLIMFGWIPAVLYIFKRFPPQKAIVLSFIVAWLFLPVAAIPVKGLPDYTKMTATCYGILLATSLFDSKRFSQFKFGWLDVPMLVWCLSPFMSSMANGLGAYDGFSSSLAQTVTWGAPYFLGRIYLNTLVGMQELAIGIFMSGLIYMPLCLYENRMSPQIHRMVYGFYAVQDMSQAIRYGGYRPIVFMSHGLAVGMWMMSATLIGIWLLKAKVLPPKLWGMSTKLLVFFLFITFLNARSTGAYGYFLIAIVVLFTAKWFKTSLPLLLLILFIAFYLYNNVVGNFSSEKGAGIIQFISDAIGADRAQSIEFRWQNEDILGARAREQMLFGWGGWGRARVYDPWGKDISVTDSLWIIAFGNQGVVGVISLTASLLLPSLSFFGLRYPARTWSHPKVAPAALMMIILVLFMLDCVLNAMINPIFTLACGGVVGLVLKEPAKQKSFSGVMRNGNRPTSKKLKQSSSTA